jgi:hypothetical protein
VRKIVKLIISFLLKKGIVRLSKIEDSFFLYKKLDKRIKIDRNIIDINYGKESPYSGDRDSVVSIVDRDNLYLWFFKEDFNRYVPEAYIIFRKLSLEYQNVIFIIKGDIDKSVVIKDFVLLSSFSKGNLSKTDILLLKEEFSITKIVEMKMDEYQNYTKDAFEYLRINDILNILKIDFDFKKLLIDGVHLLSLPVFISSIVVTMTVFGYSLLIGKEKDKLFALYKQNQKVNYKLKESIDKNIQESILYKEISKEFRYIDKSIALSKILETTEKMKMNLYYIKIYDNNVNFTIKTKNNSIIPIYIKKLFKSNLFDDIKNLNSRKSRDSIIEVRMSAKLKEI